MACGNVTLGSARDTRLPYVKSERATPYCLKQKANGRARRAVPLAFCVRGEGGGLTHRA